MDAKKLASNGRETDLSAALAVLFVPRWGEAGREFANAIAQGYSYGEDPDESLVETARFTLLHRLKNPKAYSSERMTKESIEEALRDIATMPIPITVRATVRLRGTPQEHWFNVGAIVGGESVGILSARVLGADSDDPLWVVSDVHVDRDHRRQGLGTALYEKAAAEAERRGGRLASISRVSEESIGFWQKQLAAGRVDKVETDYDEEPVLALKPGTYKLKNNTGRASLTLAELSALPVGSLVMTGDGLRAWRRVQPAKSGWEAQKPTAGASDGWGPRSGEIGGIRVWQVMVDVLQREGLHLWAPRLQGNPTSGDRPRGLPWPKDARVYHATIASRAIDREGFKTRRQRGGEHALGGGTDVAVSFTVDPQTARAVSIGLRTIRRIALGEIGLGDLIIQASTVAPTALKQINLAVELGVEGPEDVVRIDRGLRKIKDRGLRPPREVMDHLVRLNAIEEMVDHGHGYVSGWVDSKLIAQLDKDPREMRNWLSHGQYRAHIVEIYKNILHFGMADRALYNPLFFNTNLAALAAVDEVDIGVVRAKINADWLCADYQSAEALGYDMSGVKIAPATFTQWAEGCEVELDRSRYDDDAVPQGPRDRSQYHHTLPAAWDPPSASDTLAYFKAMAELRVWNLALITDVGLFEDLDDSINEARDAWDQKGLVVDDPFWLPYHKDKAPFSFVEKVRSL